MLTENQKLVMGACEREFTLRVQKVIVISASAMKVLSLPFDEGVAMIEMVLERELEASRKSSAGIRASREVPHDDQTTARS